MIAAIVMPLAVLLPLETQRRFEIRSEQAREGAGHFAATVAIAIDRTFVEQRRLLEAAGERFDLGAAGGQQLRRAARHVEGASAQRGERRPGQSRRR